jgi:3'(2'), 5'-bisphosphate nucleotidase
MQRVPRHVNEAADERARLLQAMFALTVTAGGIIWDYVQSRCAIERKANAAPVTAADPAAKAVILAGLPDAAPGIPVVAEEDLAAGRLPDGATFFLVDALGGRKEFISGATDDTVNIGLVERGIPTLGVVDAPARSTLYWADTVVGKAWRATQPPHGARAPALRISVGRPGTSRCAVASKSHSTPEPETRLRAAVIDCVSIGSSLKFVLFGAGETDVYPRPAPTKEWDTAAGDAVLRAAGGEVLHLDSRPLLYEKPRFLNPGCVATGLYEPSWLLPCMRFA